MLNFHESTDTNIIVKITTFLIFPFTLIYGLYIFSQGESAPGGGFQAGVVLAVAYSLFLIVFGPRNANKIIPFQTLVNISAIGVLIYLAVGFASLLLGGNFLEYKKFTFAKNPQSFGLFFIELGVLLCIFGGISVVMYSFYMLIYYKKPTEKS